ncbi:MAG: patatin-like phospholipase family protein [Ferruginibacter sp.]
MKSALKNFYHFFPVQLFLLHFRKYQVLLLFWYVLGSTINSGFMKNFGADALFFAPEYLGSVNLLGAFITGMAWGVFIMSWNITTFILHSKRFLFLATTGNPFLKYCINNFIFPLLFLIFYFIKLYRFDDYKELMSGGEILGILSCITLGIFVLIALSFLYFFRAGKTIDRTMATIIGNPELFNKTFTGKRYIMDEFGLKINYYLSARFEIRKARGVGHYRRDFLDRIFSRHHLAAMFCMLLAFVFLMIIGFFLEVRAFEMPAAASILVFFAIMIAFIGALTYFLQSWSLPFTILMIWLFNYLYQNDIIDPRNKAYGLNYTNESRRPAYTRENLLSTCYIDKVNSDKANMIKVLNNWKRKQKEEKPLMIFVNVSGGGLRSAAFVMNAMQKLDSLTHNEFTRHSVLISGASGGMLAATYYRELYRFSLKDSSIRLWDSKYAGYITRDLLNPVFTSMMARDIFAPVQKFKVGNQRYIKDRGYAFEKKLSDNTRGILNIQLKDLVEDEFNARIPLIVFNSVIKADGRKLIMNTQPMSFMMKPVLFQNDSTVNPDAVDFASLFKDQQPMNLRVLTAMRMNATFPYVLPNVWLPSNPVIDVMDAGLRDNIGMETTLRFIDNFRDWIEQNTSGVLIVQLRDRVDNEWENNGDLASITDVMVTPATMLQHNWFYLQYYNQTDQFNYFDKENTLKIKRIALNYRPEKREAAAALNFHLSAREKSDVLQSFNDINNKQSVDSILSLLNR